MQKPKNEPFFTRFLEGQFPAVDSDIRAGKGPGGATTPSVDLLQTMKYPSDGDDDGPTI